MIVPLRITFPLLLFLLVTGVFALVISYDWVGDPLIRDFESRRTYLEPLNRLADAATAKGSDLCENGSKTSKNPAEIELRALLSKQHFFFDLHDSISWRAFVGCANRPPRRVGLGRICLHTISTRWSSGRAHQFQHGQELRPPHHLQAYCRWLVCLFH